MTAPLYPRGLCQPPGAYRFGLEALLLAAFAARTLGERGPGPRAAKGARREAAVAELGSGCGAALLGVALRCAHARGLGLEREPALVAAAAANARVLGLAERVRFQLRDAADLPGLARVTEAAGAQDMVLANPPWGLPGHGRASPSALREGALRGNARDASGDALPLFCAAAAALLRHRGAFCCIVPARALTRICAALDAARLGLRRVLPVRPHRHKPAHRLLLLAQKGACAEPQLLAPLTLHGRAPRAGTTGWTAAALAFCPWLAARAPAHRKSRASTAPASDGGTP